MTPDQTNAANTALLFELDEQIDARLKQAIHRYLLNGGDSDITYIVGRALLNNSGFMHALTEEVVRVVHTRFNSSVSSFGRTAYF